MNQINPRKTSFQIKTNFLINVHRFLLHCLHFPVDLSPIFNILRNQTKLLFYCMSYTFKEKQEFLLPETKISANNLELNDLKKRMLANYYERQIRQKSQEDLINRGRRSSLDTPQTRLQNPEQSRITKQNQLTHFQINQMQIDRERMMRMQLAQEYEKQMKNKQLQKQKQFEQKKREDAVFAERFLLLSNMQNQKIKKNYEIKRNNMQEHISMVQKQREEKMEMKKKQQQIFNERYNMPRSTSLGTIQASPKLAQFKKHYENINSIQKQIENNYIQKWSPIIKQRQYEKQKLTNIGIMRNMHESSIKNRQHSQQEQRLQNDLKSTLIKQIVQRQKQKQQEQRQLKNEQYTTRLYEKIYHPICNPVDFRVVHDNKYILRELKQEKQHQDRQTQSTRSQGLSGLARNGSFTLLAK